MVEIAFMVSSICHNLYARAFEGGDVLSVSGDFMVNDSDNVQNYNAALSYIPTTPARVMDFLHSAFNRYDSFSHLEDTFDIF